MSGVEIGPTLRVAVPVPLYGGFDYLDLDATDATPIGSRVLVRFGKRRLVGVVLETEVKSDLPRERLRPIEARLDDAPVFDDELLGLLRWAAGYYHHPIGEALATALPVALRRAKTDQTPNRHRGWQAVPSDTANEPVAHAKRQHELLDVIRTGVHPVAHSHLLARFGSIHAPLKALERRGLIEEVDLPGALEQGSAGTAPALTDMQREAVEQLISRGEGFHPTLLEGVTGSGKTEVYCRQMAEVLAANRQVLFLAPEIGLTPQLIERLRTRFDASIGVLHSQRSDGERADVWRAARAGDADIVIGTRSAVFTPMPRLGLIVVDEEHDGSYKQQDGFRYHARDVALRRAQQCDIPIVLGSATPALESLHNADRSRFAHLKLPERATGAAMPPVRVIDIRSRPLLGGLSDPMLAHIERHLTAGNQVMVFINRRGYAPALSCHDCGWIAPCERCDAPLTLHGGGARLQCHHCGAHQNTPAQCPSCGSKQLIALGAGTERVAGALRSRFPDVRLARFDRDSVARKGRLESQLADVASGETQLLVGTQMLAKGHDFARLTCVAVLDVDGGLFSADFRAAEHMAQLVTQVAGRAGRSDLPGEVWLQTRHPEHPLLHRLLSGGYDAFARAALAERREAALPPFGYLCLLRAEAQDIQSPQAFLEQAAATIHSDEQIACWGPVPAPMQRRAGRFRAHLLLHSSTRARLHPALDHWQRVLGELPGARRVRWSIDVDPQDLL